MFIRYVNGHTQMSGVAMNDDGDQMLHNSKIFIDRHRHVVLKIRGFTPTMVLLTFFLYLPIPFFSCTPLP